MQKHKKRKYVIPFVGLNLGEHLYEFDITDEFFDEFEYSEIKRGNIKVELSFQKQSAMFILVFHISGTVNVACDRCLDDFDLPINETYQLIVKMGNEALDSDEIISIPETETEIDIAPYIYEYIILSLPYRRIHPPKGNGCNKEVIKKLGEVSSNKKEKKEIDPRWEKLTQLKKK